MAEQKFEYYDNDGDLTAGVYGTWAQTFTASVGHNVTKVRIKLYRGSHTSGTVYISLRATSGGTPYGSDLCVTSIPMSTLTTTPTWYEFTLPYGSLIAGIMYALVVTSPISDSSGVYWRRGGGMSGGQMWLWTGTYWLGISPYNSYDGGFSIWGDVSITTNTATSIEPFQAAGNATLLTTTGIDQYGFEWGEVSGTYTDEVMQGGSPGGLSYSLNMTNLYASKVYYFRAKIHHSTHGWLYGGELYFKTTHDTSLLLYEYQNTQYGYLWNFYGANWGCQTFTPAISHQIRSVALRISNGADGIITVSIRNTDGAGKPTGSDLCYTNVPGTYITGGILEFGFGDGIVLTAGIKYAICWRKTGSLAYALRANSNVYANGAGGSGSGGTSWTMQSWDFWFEEYGYSGVETYPATNIKQYQVTGNGSILDPAGIDEVGFEWGETEGGPYPDDITEAGSFYGGPFSETISGLSHSTLYYYRTKIHHTSLGWLYGNEESFTTKPPTPTMITNIPSEVGDDYILADGTIEDPGSENDDERGFVYGLTSVPTDPGNVAPSDSGYDDYVHETGSFGASDYLLLISSLTVNKRYYVRAYAHNSYGYSYGDEVFTITNATVNVLCPSSDYSKGIRFDSSPGGGYPHPGGGTIPHWMLCRSEDSEWINFGVWGYMTGNFVYEHDYYNSNMYTDIYGLTNPSRRTEGVIKIKWKASLLKNSYPYGEYKRILYTYGTTYEGTQLGIGIGTVCEVFYTNPHTGSVWTISELDNLMAGISIGEGGGWGTPACDAVKVVVLWANAYARTDPANYLSETSYRLNGYVLEDEAESCEVYFQWGPTSGYGNTTTAQTKVKGQSFLADITASGEIHFRTVITTACGETFYGSDRSTLGVAMTLPLHGLFVRGDEIQATFTLSGISRPYRSPDFGGTWYPCAGLDNVPTGDVGFDSRNVQNSFFGGSGHLYVLDSVDGETFTYVEGSEITGDVDQIDIDLDLPISLIATNLKLYKSVDWGNTVMEMLDQPVRDVAFGGVALAPEQQIDLLTPTGDSEYRQLTPVPSTPTTHWDKVVEASDSKKCSNPQGGYGGYGEWGYQGRLGDTYFFTNLRGEGTITGITVYATVGVNSALMSYNFILRLNGVNYFSGFSTTGSGTVSNTWNTNPATGNPWQKSEIQNGTFQAGLIISDTGVPSGCWIDKIWVVVNWA